MMSTKEKLIELLEKNAGEYLSGSVIAERLGITRAAIWKQVRQLEKDGYRIEAVTNKGYRLDPLNDAVTLNSMKAFLRDRKGIFTLEVRDSLSSTNTILKEKAGTLPDWYVMVAGSQSAGRGRGGREFFSPKGTGVYLSVLLRPDIPVSDAGRLTTAAAVAACRAIEACTDAHPEIKWVNDVFVGGKKVCGILTEASVNFETGAPEWLVTGIGFNVYPPEEGFPAEIVETAGAITERRGKNLRARLAAEFVKHFYTICGDLSEPSLYNEYKKRCFILGKSVFVLQAGESVSAEAVDIDKDFGLLVRYGDGRAETLSAGEVSIRPGED